MSVLSEIFGECPQIKIVETFAENYNDKLYVADIVRMTDVSKITVNNHVNKLLEEGIIEKKDKAGNIQYYQLNMNNPKAKIILLLERFIISERLGKLVSEKVENELEEKIEEDLENQDVATSRVQSYVPDISIHTKYEEEISTKVDIHPFIDPNGFTKPIPVTVVGAGYSIVKSGETYYG